MGTHRRARYGSKRLQFAQLLRQDRGLQLRFLAGLENTFRTRRIVEMRVAIDDVESFRLGSTLRRAEQAHTYLVMS